jgi:hypothetical protein
VINQKRTCDYCERPATAACTYRVTVAKVTATGDTEEVVNLERDLCDRDLTRMLAFIRRGVGLEKVETAPAK